MTRPHRAHGTHRARRTWMLVCALGLAAHALGTVEGHTASNLVPGSSLGRVVVEPPTTGPP